MENFDIYDDLELLHAQQKEKEDEEFQWKKKYQVAIATIEKLQSEKKGLNKKIKQLEINFASLLDTARSEIKRKDNQIYELRKEKDNICFRRNARSLNNQSVDYLEDQRRTDSYVNPFVGEPNNVVLKRSSSTLDKRADEKQEIRNTKQENVETEKRCSRSRREQSSQSAGRYSDRNQQCGRDTHRNDKSSNYKYNRHDRISSETRSSDSNRESLEKDLTNHTQRSDHTKRPHSRNNHTTYEKPYTSLYEHTALSRHERHTKDKQQQRSEHKKGNPTKCTISDVHQNKASSVTNEVSAITNAALEEEILKDVKALKKVKKTEDDRKEVNLEAEKFQAAIQKSNTFLDALFDDLGTTNQEEKSKDKFCYDLVLPIPTREKSVKIDTEMDKNCNLQFQQVTPVKQPVSKLFEELFGPSPAGSTISTAVRRRTSLSSFGGSSCDATVFIPCVEGEKPMQSAPADAIIDINIDIEKLDKQFNEAQSLQTGKAVDSAKTFQFVELDSSFYSSDGDDSKAEGQKESQSDIDSPPFEKCRMLLNDSIISNESESGRGGNSDGSRRLLQIEQRLDTPKETIVDCKIPKILTDHANDGPKSSSNEISQDDKNVHLPLDKDREFFQRKDSHRPHHHSKQHSKSSTSSRSSSSHKKETHQSERSRHEETKHHHNHHHRDRTSSRKHSKDDRHHSLRGVKQKHVKVKNDLVGDLVKRKKKTPLDENSSDLKLYQDKVILLQCDDISDEEGYEANIQKTIDTEELGISLRCEESIMVANNTVGKDAKNVNGKDSTVNSSNTVEQSQVEQNDNVKPMMSSCVNEDINEKTKDSVSISTANEVKTTETGGKKRKQMDCVDDHPKEVSPSLLLAEDELNQTMENRKPLLRSLVVPEIATSTSEHIEEILNYSSVVIEKAQPAPLCKKLIQYEMISTGIPIEKTITLERTKLVVNASESSGENKSTTPSLLYKSYNGVHIAKEVEERLEPKFGNDIFLNEDNKSSINKVTLIAEVEEQFQVRTEEVNHRNNNTEPVSNGIHLIAEEHMEKDTITKVFLDKCVPVDLNKKEVDQSSFRYDCEIVNSYSQEQMCNLIISDASKSSEDTEESTLTGRRKKLKTPRKCADVITATTELMTMLPSLNLTCDDKSDSVSTPMVTESYSVDLLPPIGEIKASISEELTVSTEEGQPEMPALWVDDESTEAVAKSVGTNSLGTQITDSNERNDESTQHTVGITESDDGPSGLIAVDTILENESDESNLKAAEIRQEVEVVEPSPSTANQTEYNMILLEIPIEEPTTEERIENIKNSFETSEHEDMALDVIAAEINPDIESDPKSNAKAVETSQEVETEVELNMLAVETSHKVCAKVLEDKSENTFKGFRSEERPLNCVLISRKRPRNNDDVVEVVEDDQRAKIPKQKKIILQDSTTFCSKDEEVHINKELVPKSDQNVDVIGVSQSVRKFVEVEAYGSKEQVPMSNNKLLGNSITSTERGIEEQNDPRNHSQRDNKLNFVENPIDMVSKQNGLQNSQPPPNTCELIIKKTMIIDDGALEVGQSAIIDKKSNQVQTTNEKDKKGNSLIISHKSDDTEVLVSPNLQYLDAQEGVTNVPTTAFSADIAAAKKSSQNSEKEALLEMSQSKERIEFSRGCSDSCVSDCVSDRKQNENAAPHSTNVSGSAPHTDEFQASFAKPTLAETDLTSNIQRKIDIQSEETSSPLHKHPIVTCDKTIENISEVISSVSKVPPTVSDQNEADTSAQKPEPHCVDRSQKNKKYTKKISNNFTDSNIADTTEASQSQEKLKQLSSSCNPESPDADTKISSRKKSQCIDSVDDTTKEQNHDMVPVVSVPITTECTTNRENKTQLKKKTLQNSNDSDGTHFAGDVEPSLENMNALGVRSDNELQFKGHLPPVTPTTNDRNNRKTKSTVSKAAPSTEVLNDNAHVNSTVKSSMSRKENKPYQMNSSEYQEDHYTHGETNVVRKPLKKYKKRISQDATNWAWKHPAPTCSNDEHLESHTLEIVSSGYKRKYARKTSTPTNEQTQTLVEATPKPKRKYTKKDPVCTVPEVKDPAVVVKFPTITIVPLQEPTSQELQSAINSITFSQEPDTCSLNVQSVETSVMNSSTTFSDKSPLQDERESNAIYIKRRIQPSKNPKQKRKLSTSTYDTSNLRAVPFCNMPSSSIEMEICKRSVSQEKSLPAGTPTHKIFHDDVFPDPDSLPPVYNENGDDVQYQEIENRMRSIFQSPTYPHLNSLNLAIPSNSCVELQVDITKGDITIDETLEQSMKSQCDTSTSSKKLSVGSNDYVIETVGAHTANVFITRRKFKKRTKVAKPASIGAI